jgi:hypothetical protein
MDDSTLYQAAILVDGIWENAQFLVEASDQSIRCVCVSVCVLVFLVSFNDTHRSELVFRRLRPCSEAVVRIKQEDVQRRVVFVRPEVQERVLKHCRSDSKDFAESDRDELGAGLAQTSPVESPPEERAGDATIKESACRDDGGVNDDDNATLWLTPQNGDGDSTQPSLSRSSLSTDSDGGDHAKAITTTTTTTTTDEDVATLPPGSLLRSWPPGPK